MGYTHYMRRKAGNPGSAQQFYALAMDAKKIISLALEDGLIIQGPDGTGDPEFNEAYFAFNGDASTSHDYETFFWAGNAVLHPILDSEEILFSFCKTAYRPYDRVVGAVLLRAKSVYQDLFQLSSDGDLSDAIWMEARALYALAFGSESSPSAFDRTTWWRS